jgi:murein DD-endopeptidase MepM/ murein hydrolase activator NlpD
MTQVLPRTVLVLMATSALCACGTPRYPVALAAAAPQPPAAAPDAGGSAAFATARASDSEPVTEAALRDLEPIPAVEDGSGDSPRLILAAARHRRHAKPSAHHRAASHEAEPAGAPGAAGKVIEVESGATYKVRSGDSLDRIADKLGTSVKELKKLNRLHSSLIHPGQVLKGPRKSRHVYVVHSGDRLADVAKRLDVTEKALRAENGLSRHSRLRAGQRLDLPTGYHDRGAPEPKAAAARSRGSESRSEAPMEVEEISRGEIGRVVDAEGPARTHRVRRGETLSKIADELGTSVAQLKRDNHLHRSLIHPGQVLKGPRTRAKAYVVGPGDTIYGIARRFGVSADSLLSANGLSRRRASIHTGEKLVLPSGFRDHGPPPERPRLETAPPPTTSGRPQETPPSGPQPYTPPARPSTPPANAPAVLPTAPTAPSDAQITQLGRGRFVWPLSGEIVSDFGPKSVGQRNDGINIRASLGDPVRAAAAGDVVYAGDQVPGFGNLVLIKHADGWVTAYAHLARVDVKMQQKVAQGQQIGLAGQTGGLSEPQLHFEVRYAPSPLERARPVDPKLVLPQP